ETAASGPGLVVCDPVAVGADAATASFGDGCARWLHFTVAGQGALGKTPSWSARAVIPQLLGRNDARLSLADAAQLSRALGVTHVAVGRISGSAKRCTLTYQLYEVPARKAVGKSK